MIDFLFNPKGRVSQKGLFVFLAAMVAWKFGAGALHTTLGPSVALNVALPLIGLLLLWPKFAVPAKRLHDAGRTGWWVILGPLILIIAGGVGGLMAVLEVTTLEEIASGIEPDEAAVAAAMQQAPAKYWILIASYAGIALTALTGLLPANDGDNKYGVDPRQDGGLGLGS